MTAHWQIESVDGHLCRVTSPQGFIFDFKNNEQLIKALLNSVWCESIVTMNGDVVDVDEDGEMWAKQVDVWVNPEWSARINEANQSGGGWQNRVGLVSDFQDITLRYLERVLDEANRLG